MRDILKRNAIVAAISLAAGIGLAIAGLPVWLVAVIAVAGGSVYEYFGTRQAEKQVMEALQHARQANEAVKAENEQLRRVIKKLSRHFAQQARKQA